MASSSTLSRSALWLDRKCGDDPWYMIDVAEHHAKTDQVSREEMDEYSVITHKRCLDAIESGRLDDEVVAIDVPMRNGGTKRFQHDENPRADINTDTLAELPTVEPGGAITAGNAASINDGSAAALLCSEAGLAKLGLAPLAKVLMPGTAMGRVRSSPDGAIPASMPLTRHSQQAEKSVDDLDLIECNEGFSVQLLACERAGGWSRDRLNVDGGSVGLGHPVGMSGLRIVIHLAHAMRQRDLRLGGATVPAGSGLGTAVLLERG